MSAKKSFSRLSSSALALAFAVHAGGAAALEFNIFDTPVTVDTLFTIGGTVRMQDIDHSLIGKSTLTPGLCLTRVDDPTTAADGDEDHPGPRGSNTFGVGEITRNCSTSAPPGSSLNTPSPENLQYVAAPGSYSFASDDGNLQFERYDVVHAVAKISSDISFSVADFNFFIRPTAFYDQVYQDHEIVWPDTTARDRVTPYPDARQDVNGWTGIDILDANVSKTFELFGRSMGIKVGKQALNWGESSLLLVNSLNTLNPPDLRRLRLPGLDLKEVLQPAGMVVFSTDVVPNIGLEMFYQYQWEGFVVDPVGAFQSPADILGAGGRYAMLGLGKAPEDPEGLFGAIYTCTEPDPLGLVPVSCVDSLGLLGSASSRTAPVFRRTPENGGQYGFALKTFLEDFNNGTELSFYFANYHSRSPIISAIAAPATCIGESADETSATYGQQAALGFAADCEYNGPGVAAGQEPIPIDRSALLVEYPEDIRMFGVSFNTTVGDWAWSGEYAYRPNLPLQVHTVDLVFSALLPAFPAKDVPIPLPGAAAVTIPGRQSAFPTFLNAYRGLPCDTSATCFQPGQYIAGYEEMKSGQLNLTALRLIGGDNILGASQITFLFEMGLQHVLDFPELSELQFQGGGTNTHISGGADGSQGIDPPAVPGNSRAVTLRQNPTAHADHDGFGSEYSYGYRNINLIRWDDALFGANLQGLAIIRHDIGGTSPGIGNFVEGRKQFNLGLSFEYLSSWIGEVRYTWFTGGAQRDGERDKDNIFLYGGYQF